MADARYRKAEGYVSTGVEDDVVLMSLEAGSYYGIGGAGGAVWAMLDEPRSEAELVEGVMAAYAVDRETCTADVRAFLADLKAKGLVEEA